jgi:hypothetical protein
MRVILAGVGVSVLIACGGQSGPDAAIFIDPPQSGDSCVGVAGFHVVVTPAGEVGQEKHLVGPGPILDAKACALPAEFSIKDLDVDSPVTVNVRGYDGTGVGVRVSASRRIQNLRESAVRVPLEEDITRPPLLVFQRNLEGAAASAIDSMTIRRQMGSVQLLSVSRATAGEYLNAEPGAYGIRALAPMGGDQKAVLVVNYEVPGRTIKEQRIELNWTGIYYDGRTP